MPQFLVPLDLNRNELRNAVFQQLATAPIDPVNGQFYWDTSLGCPRIWDGSAWKNMLGAEGTVIGVAGSAPITSTGGTSPTIGITDATPSARGAMTAADKTKLNGIATGATANATDAQLRDRSTHTGTQSPATIAMATARFLGRVTAGTGPAEELTAAQAKTLLSYAIGDVSGLQAALNALQAVSQKNQAGGYAGLDAQGKIAPGALPALAVTDTFVVANQAAMLALTAETGDVAVRTDLGRSFILRTEPATTLANWQELLSPSGTVTSVTGTAPIASTGGTSPVISLNDLGVTAAKLAANSVTTSKILGGNVTGDKLADGAVTANKLGAVAGTGLTGGAGSVLAVDTAVVARKFSATLAAQASQVITHNLGTRDVQVTVRQVASPYAQIFTDVEMTTDNTVTVRFASAPTNGAYRATVVG